ncbi:unnamed protein product [Brassica oleracea var. botrytis]|uniref:(rape) hypothetical protein n=1 Tax=Brassica napus TaxID=3708 RepID=A0A816IU19_BRANA|nr:unnamed protein product [Brassica napus]
MRALSQVVPWYLVSRDKLEKRQLVGMKVEPEGWSKVDTSLWKVSVSIVKKCPVLSGCKFVVKNGDNGDICGTHLFCPVHF